MSDTATRIAALPKAPYRGLRPYRYADQAIFFARDAERRALFRKVAIYRGVLLYGDQGSGKSSLINAGLLPLAIHEGMAPERIRVQPKLDQEIVVERVRTSDEGEAPFLASRFDSGAAAAGQLAFSVEQFEARLAEADSGPAPLLIFDQFEEWVTLAEEAQKATRSDEPTRAHQRILDMVVRLLRDRERLLHLLFVFREDYLARLNRLFVLCPELTNQYVYLTSPAANALPEIIRGPFQAKDLPPGHFARRLSADLCASIADAFAAKNDGGRINLAEVQIVCLRLWKSADAEGEFKRNGISGLLKDFLSDSLAKIDPRLRPAALGLLARLVTSSGTRNVVSEEDLLALAQKDRPLPKKVYREALDKLVSETAIVRRERRNQSYTFEIVSEFLVPWIYAYRLKIRVAYERRKWGKRAAVFAAGVLAAGGAASYWTISQNSEKALRDQWVRQAQESEQRAQVERRNSEQLSQQLGGLLDNRKTIDARIREAANTITKLTAERDKWQAEAMRQSSRADAAEKGKGDAEATGAAMATQLTEAKAKLAEGEQRYNRLTGQLSALGTQLQDAKKKTTAPPSQGLDIARLVDVDWGIMPDDAVKSEFGGNVSTTYIVLRVTISNRSNSPLLIDIGGFRGPEAGMYIAKPYDEVYKVSPKAAQSINEEYFLGTKLSGVFSGTEDSKFFFLRSARTTVEALTPSIVVGPVVTLELPPQPARRLR